MTEKKEIFTKYERARILGARALQVSMDAPLLIKVDDEVLSNLNFDPLKIAALELDSGVLPISIKRPLPERKEERLERIKIERIIPDADKLKEEGKVEKDIYEEGEIMELASPEDEFEEAAGTGDSESE
jgi:DNA-directed RNA polymerase subunit K